MEKDRGRTNPYRPWMVAGCIVAVAVLVIWSVINAVRPDPVPAAGSDGDQATQKSNSIPIRPVSTSPFLNTGLDATYVGSRACVTCHEEEHESFRHTGMGRSMALVDLGREPPDGSFDHLLSKRRYQVQRKDGKMWHRELLLTGEEEEEFLVSEFPVKYVTGSGRHALTYLVETDGFLVESPITWYASKQAWGMSPGYDLANHQGFQREIGEGCLNCHAGRAEAIDGSMHRMRIVEAAIGCERCHGPGSLHVAHHSGQARQADSGQSFDYTIVNPAHLTRELAEAVCQQCHLSAGAISIPRGHRPSEFRPGLPLHEFRHDYALAKPDEQMEVVGHVEQMHLSRCYQQDASFTCTSCHSPHGEPPPAERTAHYQAACLKCHQPQHCTVDKEVLAAESADNDCVKCHMPATDTDIPHLAFTHHRVGIHDRSGANKSPASNNSKVAGELRPFFDLSHLSETDRQRSLGLAYSDLATKEEDPKNQLMYRHRALDLLTAVNGRLSPDGMVSATLASLCFDLNVGNYAPHADAALTDPSLPPLERSNTLFLVADSLFRQERYQEAILVLTRLEQMRRHSVPMLLKAQCEQELQHFDKMEEALLQTVYINPKDTNIHRLLAERFRQRGDVLRAQRHERLAEE